MKDYMSEKEWLDIFSRNLEDILQEQYTSQTELADAIDVSEATVSRYVSGKQMPTVRSLINMSYQLSISVDELMDFGSKVW